MAYSEKVPGVIRDRKFLMISGIIAIILSAFLFFLSLQKPLDLVLLTTVISIPVLVVFIKYPKLWVWTIALSSFMFFRASDLEVTAMDVVFGGFYIGTTFIWLIWMLIFKKEKIVDSIADWLLLFFYIAAIFNSIIAVMNHVDFLDWFREYALYSNILLYFPIKHYMKDKKDMKILLALFSVSVILASIDQMRSYKEIALSQTVFAYQLGLSVRLNQTLFTSAAMISLLVSLLPMKRIYRVSIWMISGLSLIGLIVSFSRTFWVFIILGIVIMLFFINNEQRKTLVAGLSIISIAGIIVFFSVFEGKTKMMSMILSNRLMSTTKGTKDLSAYQRFIEYETVLKNVEENPMFGNGLGKTFNFYDPYLHLTQRPKNVHNGYLYIAFRLGIPMLVVFLCFLMMYLGNGLIETRRQKDEFWRLLSFSAFLTILMIAFACLTSNQFFARDGGVILAVSFAIISISSRSRKSELEKTKFLHNLAIQ